MIFLVMDAAQAAALAAATAGAENRLAPREVAAGGEAGRWALPDRVADDPAFAGFADTFAAMARGEIDPDAAWPPDADAGDGGEWVMAGLSTYLETGLLGWLRGTALAAAPAGVWLALYDGDPGDGGAGGSEVTATIRPAGRPAAGFGAPAGGAIANAAAIAFGTAAGGSTVSHVALFDGPSGGNLLLSGAIAGGPVTVAAGATVSVAAGALAVAVA